MMYVGFFVLVVALVAGVVGLLQLRKMKAINSAPKKRTGELGSNPANVGMVAAEGAVRADQPLIAPCSGKPCLYYEVEIKQGWEKRVQTENGSKTQKGKDVAHTDKTGSVFLLDDGSGPTQVDARENVDSKLDKSFEEKKSYGWGDITFGNYTVHVNRPMDGDKHAVATYCVEKIVPADGSMFVVGEYDGNVVKRKSSMGGKLILAREGMAALVGATKRNMILGFAAAGLLLPVGGAMAIFGDAPEAAADTCASMQDDIPQACLGRLYDTRDATYGWTVTQGGDYRFDAVGTGTDPMMRLWPEVEVRDASGALVFEMSATDGEPVSEAAHFEPGAYTIAVNDSHYGWADNLEGGAGFSLEIDAIAAEPATETGTAEADEEETGEEPTTTTEVGTPTPSAG